MAHLSVDPLPRFVAIYNALNAERGWWSDASCLRFAAVTAITCPGEPEEVAGAIRRVAEEIKEREGWFGQLQSGLRFILSAILVHEGDQPAPFLDEVKRASKVFRELGLRRGNVYEAMAVLILRQAAGKRPIERSAVERLQATYEELKRHHWWLTGPEDFPMCAVLAGSQRSPAGIGLRMEEVFQAIVSQGFSAGDPLQTASSILSLALIEPQALARRFHSLAEAFRKSGVAVWKSDYDELAILSFLDQPAEKIVDRVLEVRREMESLRPQPDRSLTFNLASGIAFLEHALADGDRKRERNSLLEVKSLLDMQSMINAQRAAAAAAAAH